MNADLITSKDNSLLREARAVRDGKIDEMIFVEGLRLCEEATKSDLKIHAVIFSDELAQKPKPAELLERFAKASDRVASVSEKLLASISFSKTPQGVVMLASRPAMSEEHLASKQADRPLLVVMHRITNPVNVGAILRTAEATGVTGAIATENATDPFSPKALRGAMGAAFRLPIWFRPSYAKVIEWCSSRNIKTVCADLHASQTFTEIDWKIPRALILGPETSGLSAAEIAQASESTQIPMREPVESLNVSVAAGVLLYEAARQRSLFS
ncbi:MAG TPA: RNA methyltransferase [Pyrinomonadaceae bacterium]|nr:RNA methyltransferase [Pyrinomonadaceae bacterium]